MSEDETDSRDRGAVDTEAPETASHAPEDAQQTQDTTNIEVSPCERRVQSTNGQQTIFSFVTFAFIIQRH